MTCVDNAKQGNGTMPGMHAEGRLALWACLLAAGSAPALALGSADTVLSQTPLFVNQALAPLNMLVMGRDHKLYYEAYNDASDLDGDGVIEVGYKPDQIDYYGYFNSNVCYDYSGGVFTPSQPATGNRKKKCSNSWSGDFLNYLGTSRMDAIRRVLYGGMRVEDTASRTVLQAAYVPRDAHTWGKAYDPVRDGKVYSISDYAPLGRPASGTRHLFAVTTLSEAANVIPQLRVLNDSSFQIWDWVSQEGNAGQNNCNGKTANSCIRGSSRITDYNLRVQACSSTNAQLREATCKAYPNGGKTVYKPTGLLHDFGENAKMYFGLLTGSYEKNISGGVLRRNISNFAEEVDPQTGQFKSGVNGVVANIDRQRLIGYNGTNYGACGWITSGSISSLSRPSDCAMWGNPIGEMMFETMRYFSGAAQALGIYDYASGSSKDATLGLSRPVWEPPYKSKAEGGGGYQHCARPVMTVLSDINPSYDGKLPGSRYASVSANASALNGFNVSNEVSAIGAAEGMHGRNFFIGQSASNNADQAPSVKTIGDLSWARGLSPEEPSKEGTYYAAGVARFGASNAIFGNSEGRSALRTYSVAIASPLPEIRFPVGANRFVTIAPFAKTVSGSAGGSSVNNAVFTPTNQIVDYYVASIANTGKADADPSINGGRPYAEFRINYEDVEQGADHDMDAIARYTVALQADGKVKIDMVSEYAAGGLGQHMGYVISGTTKDGMYLEVRDKDTASAYYAYNTPPNRVPGYCRERISDPACANLGLTATRSFTPANVGDAGSFLKGPLWYAAKYGVPDRDPSKIKGDPDNYFLVTNAGTLKEQLTKAFNDILQNISSVTAVSVDMPTASMSEGADVYRTSFEAESWSGDVIREKLTTGSRTLAWSAAERLSERSADDRRIYYPSRTGGAVTLSPFTFSSLSGQPLDASWLEVLNTDPVTNTTDGQARKRIEFLRGQARDELRVRKLLANGKPNVLGDIVNSSLVRVKAGLYRASAADKLEGSSGYAAFAAGQASREMLYVGANDGMLHAFDAATGREEFAFIPSGVKDALHVLTSPKYGVDGASHRYFVDGTPVLSDVYFGNAWHRVLIGSLGAGGRQIFALDVTDPTAPRLLWEFGLEQDERMGYSLPTPVVARLNDSGQTKGRWVVFLSNGYQGLNSASGESSLFVLDISSGAVIRRFDLASGMTTAELNALPAPKNGLSRAAVVDNNGDGKVDMAYAGDLAGNMWRVDLASGASGSWDAQLFFVARDAGRGNGAGNRLPITAAPYVVRHPSGKGDVVAFGTGRFMTDDDKQDARRQTVFGVWDRYSTPAIDAPRSLPTAGKGRGDLQAQQFTQVSGFPGKFALSANPVTWYRDGSSTADSNVRTWGWYVDLPRDGERLVYDMSLYGRGLVFTSIRPMADPCSAGLASTIYAIDPNTGGKTDYVAFDVNKDGIFNASDNLAGQQVNGYEVGPGKPAISGAKIFDSSGKPSGAGGAGGGDDINSGVDRGRQNWRRQPPNP